MTQVGRCCYFYFDDASCGFRLNPPFDNNLHSYTIKSNGFIWRFFVVKKFQIAILASLFFSFCNAAIYRADEYSINTSSVYCLYDWHKCTDASVNGMQRGHIVAAVQKIQQIYGKDQVVVIAEDALDCDLSQAMYNGLSDHCKKVINDLNASNDRELWYEGCPYGLTALCKRNGIACYNIDFRHIQYLHDWGTESSEDSWEKYRKITQHDASTVFNAVKHEVMSSAPNIALPVFSNDPQKQLLKTRLCQRIIQNLHKKCIIVVAGGAHIESIASVLRKRGTVRTYGPQDDDQLVIIPDESENNCLAAESVFDLQKFFDMQTHSSKSERVMHASPKANVPSAVVLQSSRATTLSTPIASQDVQKSSLHVAPTKSAQAADAAQEPRRNAKPSSWAATLWAYATLKNIAISALCAACAYYMLTD